MDLLNYVILCSLLVVFIQVLLINFKYYTATKTLKKTKKEVSMCVDNINEMKKEFKDLESAILTIDTKIQQIESEIAK